MKGNLDVIVCLKELLCGEFVVCDQYFIYFCCYEDQGLFVLYECLNYEMEEEIQYVDVLLCWILFFGGDLDMCLYVIEFGKIVEEMLQKDFDIEYVVWNNFVVGMKLCEEKGDYVSCDILLVQLKDIEEDYVWWLEQQLGLIKCIGLELYQLSKIDGSGVLVY